ncbi:cytochrome P450 2A4-like [Pelodytes ibericus]
MNFSEVGTFLLALCTSGLLLFFVIKKIIWKTGNLPPGPTPLPLLGNVLQLKQEELVQMLLKFSKVYGEVYTVYLGLQPFVVFTGYKTVKEVLIDRGDEFLARGNTPFDASYNNYGLAFTSDMKRWRDLRRFSLTALRDFGMGKRSIEDRIQEEAACLVTELRKTKEAVVEPRQYLSKAPGNIIFSIMFGNRHEYEDEELLNMLDLCNKTLMIVSTAWGQLNDIFPRFMRFIPGPHHMISKYMETLLHYVEKRVTMNQKTLDPNNPRDYVDAFLIKMEKEKMDPRSEFNLTNLVSSTLQIFFAGVETMGTTLTYSLLIMMRYPDILDKVHEEIDRVIGRDRRPKSQDRSHMPYTEAVIHEIQRFIDLIPMGLPRKTTKDVEFRGYTIPKDTNVCALLSTVLKDPACFEYPEDFNPNNFLDDKGEFKKNDAFMPLAAGKRICLGEALVRMELFLLFVTILQSFNLKSPVPAEELDLTPEVSGFGNFPRPYKMAFVSR